MTFYLDTEHQLEGPKKKGTLVIDSKTEPQIQITVNKEFPSRLNIVFRDGGSFSPAAGTKFYVNSKEGIVVFGYAGREAYSWDRIKEIHVPQSCFAYKGMDFDALTKRYEERCKDLFKKDTYVRELERDLELLRAFLWDDHDETWPEDVHAALHRASDRLLRTRM